MGGSGGYAGEVRGDLDFDLGADLKAHKDA